MRHGNTTTIQTGNANGFDARLDAAFGPLSREAAELLRRSIEIHEVAAAAVVADSDLHIGRAVI